MPSALIAKGLLHDKGCSALAGLTVDADDRFVLPPQIGRINGQVGYFPIG